MNIFQLVPRGKKDDENSFPEAKMFWIIWGGGGEEPQ